MDIHRPKPVRHWREFLKEVGIIVLGVPIALGAEQTVEWLHWHYEAEQAGTHLRQDAATILLDMQERLLASGDNWTVMTPFYTSGPPAGSTYAHPMRGWPAVAWTNAVASTAAEHLPDEKLNHYAEIFAAAAREANNQALEHENSSELNVLGSSLTLTPDQKAIILGIIEAERARNRVMSYEADNTLPQFAAPGMDVDAARAAALKTLAYRTCVANGLN